MLTIYGFITGLFSSLVGVSGGAISNAVLTLYGQPMQRAVATSAGIGVPITIAGTIGYILAGWRHMAELPPLSIGFVSLIGLVLMAPVSSYHHTLWRAAWRTGCPSASSKSASGFSSISSACGCC